MDDAVIVGNGIVGNATGNVFGIKKRFDINETKSNISIEMVASHKFVFICLPTPFLDNVGYNTNDIYKFIQQIEKYGSNCIYIIRSTVNPGFASSCMAELGLDRIISNPEFLSEATAEKDSKNPPFVLLGGLNPEYLQEVKAFYEGRLKGSPVILTSNTTAELAKLALNGFFATKVIYANQIYDVARKIGANYETIRGVLERHPYGFKNHSQVWFRGKRGIHGNCLPKDTRALGYYTNAELINKVNELNEQYINIKETK